MAYRHHPQPSAPTMYPSEQLHRGPTPPPRADIDQDPQVQRLLTSAAPPPIPDRMDKSSANSTPVVRSLRNDNEENTNGEHNDCLCNYDRYATKKTIGHILFNVALLASNALQLRILILQKQRDGIWIASLVLVCVAILIQLGLIAPLYLLIKGDIRNPNKQVGLARLNSLTMVIISLTATINIVINILMLSTNRNSFFDTQTLEQLQHRT